MPNKTWIEIPSECVWCGDQFHFYSPLSTDGKPKRNVRYCSRKCIAEARWEGKRKRPPDRVLRELYVMKSMSIPAIARACKCSTSVIGKALRNLGVAMREHTSVRSCKKCGATVDKKFHHKRDKFGERILSGTLCEKHRREYHTGKAREYGRKRDPLRGSRKSGKKPIQTQCPKCGKLCESRRAAVACHNQRWHKVKQMLSDTAPTDDPQGESE
jgi:hypothetical protein